MGSEDARQLTLRWRSEFGGFLGLRPDDMVGHAGITERDMQDYQVPPTEHLAIRGVEAHFLGQYIPWDSHHNAKVAAAMGMIQALPVITNRWSHENLDNAQTGIHDFGMYLKYAYGRGCAQISVDIRSGLVERADALEWLTEHEGVFPDVYARVPCTEMLERICVTKAEMFKALQKFKNKDLFQPGTDKLRCWQPK